MSWFPELFFEELPAWFLRVMWPFIVIMLVWAFVVILTFVLSIGAIVVICKLTKIDVDTATSVSCAVFTIAGIAECALCAAAAYLQLGIAAMLLAICCMLFIIWIIVKMVDSLPTLFHN